MSVKHFVALQVILINEGWSCVCEVMDDLQNIIASQNLSQVVVDLIVEGVHAQQVEYVAVIFKADLK